MAADLYAWCDNCKREVRYAVDPHAGPAVAGRVPVVCRTCGSVAYYRRKPTAAEERAYQREQRAKVEATEAASAREAEEWSVFAAEDQGLVPQPDYPGYVFYRPEPRTEMWWRLLREESRSRPDG